MTSKHARRRDIEGLRALAVALVLLYHAQLPWFGGGFLGVDVFFVISGFLITRSLVREAGSDGRIDLRRFYARRVRRLLPAAALVLLATAAGVRLLLPVTTWRDFGGDIAAAATYVVNWRLAWRSVDYLAEDVLASPVQHFWSLAIEEQFYLLWPVLILAAVVLARRRGWPLRRVVLVVLAVVVAVPSLAWSVHATAALPARAFFDTGTRMWELAAGGLVAVAPPARDRGPAWARTVAKVVALVVLVALGSVFDAGVGWPGWAALGVVVPTAVLLRLGGRDGDVVERLLAREPLQRVGAWSYSLYLWHWPPLAILAARWGGLRIREAVAIVALSTIPAVASHHLVENPVRFQRRLVGSPRLSLGIGAGLTVVGLAAAAAVLAAVPDHGEEGAAVLVLPGPSPTGDAVGTEPIADGVAAAPAAAGGWDGVGAAALPSAPTHAAMMEHLAATRSVTPAPVAATDDLPRVYEDRCHVPVPVADVRVCEYGDPDGDLHVALIGDSKAGQWGDALEQVGSRHGWRLSYWLKSGCALTTAVPDLGGDPNETCATWNRDVLQQLVDDPPDVVLVSQVAHIAHGAEPGDPAQRLVDGMVEAYDRLEAAGVEVVVLMDNHPPHFRVYECVAEHTEDLSACTFPRHVEWGGRAAQAEAARRGGYDVLDLADRTCPTQRCLPVIGGVLVYRQGSHLTATYVDSLVPDFEQRLLALVGTGAG